MIDKNMITDKSKTKYNSVEDLPVWQKSHELTLLVYKYTSCFPKSEVYGLISQIRRSSSSIPANISEGFYRKTTKELIQFIYNARGSLGETSYHIRLSKDLGYIKEREYLELKTYCEDISKQINGWIKSLKSKL